MWIVIFALSDWLPWLGISLDVHCFACEFGTGFKMVSPFVTVLKGENLAVNEAAVPTNTKKKTKSGLSVFTGL